MTDYQLRLEAFVKLGHMFQGFCEYANNERGSRQNKNSLFEGFMEAIALAGHQNAWFTQENILYGLQNWGALLKPDNLEKWLSKYPIETNIPKSVALIMAGNIPLVGFHDFLATLITGNKVVVKQSSNDRALLPFIADYLVQVEPLFKNKIDFSEGLLNEFDTVIATGSDNTYRYFEYYFSKKPHIIRKNRNSVDVLTGNETREQLEALGEDIFRYYGLGCRSVSKIYVPKGYNFNAFFNAVYPYSPIMDHSKYANNYDYNKAVYLMSDFKIRDNGFLLLKEDPGFSSPIATLFYGFYDTLEGLRLTLETYGEKLQCVVSDNIMDGEIPFGHTQRPGLQDYADGMDTVDFLLKTEKKI